MYKHIKEENGHVDEREETKDEAIARLEDEIKKLKGDNDQVNALVAGRPKSQLYDIDGLYDG